VANPTSHATRFKEERLAALMRWLVPIQAAVTRKHDYADPTLLYVDGMAGAGVNHFGEESFDGSPLVMLEALDALSVGGTLGTARSHLVAIERDYRQWLELSVNVARHAGYLHSASVTGQLEVSFPVRGCVGEGLHKVFSERLRRNGGRVIYGLVFLDPTNPGDLVSAIDAVADVVNHRRARLDVALWTSTTQWKRVSKSQPDHPSLSDIMGKLGRSRWLTSDVPKIPRCCDNSNAFQWQMFVGTKGDFDGWSKAGFHDTESPTGRRLLAMALKTRKEYQPPPEGQYELLHLR